ncbi:MAG: S8 family serine peptidase [Myxococcota bacterium]
MTEAALGADDGTVVSDQREECDPVTVWWQGHALLADRGDIVVQFRDGTGVAKRWQAYAQIGGVPVYRSPYALVFKLRLRPDQSIEAALAAAEANADIVTAQPNIVLEATGKQTRSAQMQTTTLTSSSSTTPVPSSAPWSSKGTWTEPAPDAGPSSASVYGYEWYAHRSYFRSGWSQAPGLGGSVKVAVLDSGVSDNPSLPLARIAAGVDLVDPGWAPTDRNGHGTHMATIIAGAQRVAGVAPAATIVPVRVLDDNLVGTELALVEGLKWVATQPDIKVVSMSLAFPLDYYPSRMLLDAIDALQQKGVVMVAASGNDGASQVAFPARCPEVIAVGAARMVNTGTGVGFEVAAYSNRSARLDLVAFGGDVTRDADQNGVVDGIIGERPAGIAGPAGLYLMAGSSPASAEVAGAVALLLDAGVPVNRVRPILQATTQPLTGSARAFDGSSGMGLLNVGQALESWRAGYYTSIAPVTPVAYAASAMVLERQSSGTKTGARAWVEVSNAAGSAMPSAKVWGHFDGAVREDASALTNAAGRTAMSSTRFVADDIGFFAFSVDAVIDATTGLPIRPYGLAWVDKQSFSLLANLALGLDAHAVAIAYDNTALNSLPEVDLSRVIPAYTIQSLGTGLISSAIIFVVSPTYYGTSGLYKTSALFTSSGIDLISSAIVLDKNLFAAGPRALIGTDTLQVRNVTAGTGLISSAIIWKGAPYTFASFFVGSDPAIIRTISGTGLISRRGHLQQGHPQPDAHEDHRPGGDLHHRRHRPHLERHRAAVLEHVGDLPRLQLDHAVGALPCGYRPHLERPHRQPEPVRHHLEPLQLPRPGHVVAGRHRRRRAPLERALTSTTNGACAWRRRAGPTPPRTMSRAEPPARPARVRRVRAVA